MGETEALATTYVGLLKHFFGTVSSTGPGKLLLYSWTVGTTGSFVLGYLNKKRERRLARASSPEQQAKQAEQKKAMQNMKTQLIPLLKVAFPSLTAESTIYLGVYTLFLVLRIVLTIKIARVTGALGKMIAARTFSEMFKLQAVFGLWCFPAAGVNSLLYWARNKLSLAIRNLLTKDVHRVYMQNLVFYRANNIGHNRIEDIDQRATADLKKFSSQVAELYGNLLKPSLEVILLSRTLGSMMGFSNLMGFFAFFVMAGQWLKIVMPGFAKIHAEIHGNEGDFRSHHFRVMEHAEEIAFYGGAKREQEIVNESFDRLVKSTDNQYFLQMLMSMLDSYLVKYGASMVAYSMLIPAVYLGSHGLKGKSSSHVMQYYLTCTQLFLSLGAAAKHLVLSYKSIQELSGLTMRVGELFTMLKRRSSTTDLEEIKAMVPESERSKIGTGTIETGDDSMIRFDNVDIVSPSGLYLAKGLTFTVKKGVNVLVSGPNGCGKSSLFRILGGLWPLCGGRLLTPPISHLFYIPQKPYLCPGTLRDQVTYPQVKDSSEDSALDEVMRLVELEHIVERSGGWDAVRDWAYVLSGGEKQRVAMARLFYHRPAYGILDECTSAVSVDVEGKIYQTCAKLGITIFTVSHRPQLRHHHDFQLRFDGEGGWEWTAIDKEVK